MNEKELHEFRKQIDANIHRAENAVITAESMPAIRPYAHQMGIVTTKLQEAKMWVGKCLEKLGGELPVKYRDKHNDTTADSGQQ